MVKIAQYIFLTLITGLFLSCTRNSNVNLSRGERFSSPIPIEKLIARNELEQKAFSKISQYLITNSLDSFFVVAIIFPDTGQLEVKSLDIEYIGLEIIHAETLVYWDSLDTQNKRLQEQSEDKEWPLVIPPITGNYSGKDRNIYYYFRKDSIADILSQ
jgi:hypothetical protein